MCTAEMWSSRKRRRTVYMAFRHVISINYSSSSLAVDLLPRFAAECALSKTRSSNFFLAMNSKINNFPYISLNAFDTDSKNSSKFVNNYTKQDSSVLNILKTLLWRCSWITLLFQASRKLLGFDFKFCSKTEFQLDTQIIITTTLLLYWKLESLIIYACLLFLRNFWVDVVLKLRFSSKPVTKMLSCLGLSRR